MQQEIDYLISLQKNLHRQREVNDQVMGIPPHLSNLHESYTDMNQKRDQLTDDVNRARDHVKKLETELEDQREQRKTYRQQLMQVQNQKEYSAVLKEIDILDARIREIEDQLIQDMEIVEEGEKVMNESRDEWGALESKYTEAMKAWEKEKQVLLDELQKLEDDQRIIEQSMDPTLKKAFWRLYKARDGSAVVPVQSYTCSGCHVKLRPQQYAEVRSARTIQTCDKCNRYLYYHEQED